jgi:hypothetical protein
MGPPEVIATIVKLGVVPWRWTTVVLFSEVTNLPDTALTSCKSTILPAGVGGELSRPRMCFINGMNRGKGLLGNVGGATSNGAMKTDVEGVFNGGDSGVIVGRLDGLLVGRLVGRVGRTGNRLVRGIVNKVGSNDGASGGMRLGRRVGRLVGCRVGEVNS